jgi:hypothetical protein
MSHMKVRSSSEKNVPVAKAYPKPDWQTSVDKSVLLNRYSDFHPAVLAVMKFVLPNLDPASLSNSKARKAKDIKQWPLLFRAPIPTWHKGKLVLIGDAAHPMLPREYFQATLITYNLTQLFHRPRPGWCASD